MVIQLQTSFIPRKPSTFAGGAPEARRPAYLFFVSALVVFLLSAVLSLGVFLYRAYLVRAVSAMDTTLAAARKSFEPEFIDEAARLSSRIEAVKKLFALHRAPSLIFEMLEKKTLEAVRWRDFSLEAAEGGAATLSLTGEAKSFNAVALQSDVFGAEPLFQDPVFSNFTLSEKGNVVFDFKTGVNDALLRYRETVIASESLEDEAIDAPAEEFEL